jgi:hypothetical protein
MDGLDRQQTENQINKQINHQAEEQYPYDKQIYILRGKVKKARKPPAIKNHLPG